MKKGIKWIVLAVIIVVFIAIGFVGCKPKSGVEVSMDELANEVDSLRDKVEQLSNEVAEIRDQISNVEQLTNETAELKARNK